MKEATALPGSGFFHGAVGMRRCNDSRYACRLEPATRIAIMDPQTPVELHGSIWMTVSGENFGGPGRIELLARIAECGSITQAA